MGASRGEAHPVPRMKKGLGYIRGTIRQLRQMRRADAAERREIRALIGPRRIVTESSAPLFAVSLEDLQPRPWPKWPSRVGDRFLSPKEKLQAQVRKLAIEALSSGAIKFRPDGLLSEAEESWISKSIHAATKVRRAERKRARKSPSAWDEAPTRSEGPRRQLRDKRAFDVARELLVADRRRTLEAALLSPPTAKCGKGQHHFDMHGCACGELKAEEVPAFLNFLLASEFDPANARMPRQLRPGRNRSNAK
jgi:hypothetical protein